MTSEERITVAAILKMIEQQESHRKELRAQDDLWRIEVHEDIHDLQVSMQELPPLIDQKICDLRNERVKATDAPLRFVTTMRGFFVTSAGLVAVAAAAVTIVLELSHHL